MPGKPWTHHQWREHNKRWEHPDSATLACLAGCVRRLPLLSDRATKQSICGAASLLYWSNNDLPPNGQKAGTDAAVIALYELMNLAKELHEKLINLPSDAWIPLDNNLEERGLTNKLISLYYEDETLLALSDAAAFASRDLWSEPHTPGPRRGRPPNLRVHSVASCAARQFFSMTGRKPTVIVDRITGKAGGPFIHFLTEVFQTLEIDASPEVYARSAVMEKKAF